jgi:hypothetical protein
MWIPMHYRFASRTAFLAACDAAGWPRDPLEPKRPAPPEGAVLDEIGALIERPTIGPDGAPIPGDVLDPRWHVNAAWNGMDAPAGFNAARVYPQEPARSMGLPMPPPPEPPPVPVSVAAWKAKAQLLALGHLTQAEAAAKSAGGVPALAFAHAAEWHRTSPLVAAIGQALGMDDAALDAAFIAAAAIEG